MVLLDSLSPQSPLQDGVQALFELKFDKPYAKQQATIDFLSDLHRMFQDFRQDMREANISNPQRDVLLNGLAQVEAMLYPLNLGNPVRAMTEAERSLLQVCATIIEEEGEITEDDLTEIRKSIAELRTQVESGDISPTLKKVLLELIRLSEDAIARFTIRGARGLRRAFKAMVGEVAELYGIDEEEQQNSTAWSAIKKHLNIVDTVAAKLLKYRPLIGAATKLKVLIGGDDDL